MERHDREDKKEINETLFGENSRGRAKEKKGYQAREKSQGRSEYSNKEC